MRDTQAPILEDTMIVSEEWAVHKRRGHKVVRYSIDTTRLGFTQGVPHSGTGCTKSIICPKHMGVGGRHGVQLMRRVSHAHR
jgi:hypothetical protein